MMTSENTVQEMGTAQFHQAVHAANRMAGDLFKAKKYRSAKVALCRALTAAPDHAELWTNLSCVLWSLRSYEDSAMCARSALSFCLPEDEKTKARAHACLANALTSMGDYQEALLNFNEAIKNLAAFSVDDAEEMQWNRTLLLLLLGDLERGFQDYDIRIDRHKKEHEKDRRYSSPMWQGESLEGRRILVLHDQGYGDTLFYSRYLATVRLLVGSEGKVYVAIAPALVPLLMGYQEHGIEFLHYGAPLPRVDFHTYLGSIPKRLLDSGVLSSQSLTILPDPCDFVRERVQEDLQDPGCRITIQEPKGSPTLKIGIAWTGRLDFERNDERKIPLHLFLSLAESPLFWLYSLQAGPASQEIIDLGAEPFIANLDKEMSEKGWIGTATAVLQMDLVITCCTSIAHLCGVLGVPCWVLLCTEPYWIWGAEGETTPWYPSVRIFRQQRDRRGDWTCVMEEVRSELFQLIREKDAAITAAKAQAEAGSTPDPQQPQQQAAQ
jgi:tetratricopeptide (TPR) repeat protein